MPEEIDEVREMPPETKASWQARSREYIRRIPGDLVPLFALVATVFLVILYANDWKLWDGMRSAEETNDAYVRADVTPLSTKVSGTVSKVLINDYEEVKKGQLLVELRDDDFFANSKQAESLYKQSLEAVSTVGKQIEVQTQRIESARLATLIGGQEITRASASVAATDASLQAAHSSLEEARSQKAQAQARLEADQAVALRASQERQRQTDLFAVKASTQQTIEQVVADDDRDKSVVAADQAEIKRLSNLISERSADISKLESD
jgi:membrane fusion protein (multidrug efflux system)